MTYDPMMAVYKTFRSLDAPNKDSEGDGAPSTFYALFTQWSEQELPEGLENSICTAKPG